MGKPFAKELEKINNTLEWALSQDVTKLRADILHTKIKPLFVVGSGGSLSACYYAAILYQQCGMMAKAITPLELFYSQNTLRESNVLFISASGMNTDILFGYKSAISFEPNKMYSLCMKTGTPLAALAGETSLSEHFEFENPSGKDGFLATNSLVAFFAILYKSFTINNTQENQAVVIEEQYLNDLDLFISKITLDYTFSILYAGFGQPVAIDLESKLAEAALADVLLSDYRNFGHGRHHWFDKRKKNTAIIALITPEEELIATKTLALLPSDIPVFVIKSTFRSAFSSIDLLIKSFSFINRLGNIQGIDPGRPGVPDFGRKLYNLRYSSLFKKRDNKMSNLERIAILRKTKVPSIHSLDKAELVYWGRAYHAFQSKLSKTTFGSVIFDYDGTLCSSKNRYLGVEEELVTRLIDLLKKNIIIGIATGRGQSVRTDLERVIPQKYHKQIIIGYYNCGEMGFLSESTLPNKEDNISNPLKELHDLLNTYDFPVKVLPELKPNQITVEIKNKDEWLKVRTIIIDLVLSKNQQGIQILESSHSMDIVDQNLTSKLNILNHCIKMAETFGLSPECLCIGDKGQWPGNDYQLLTSSLSLSVDEVSSLKETCWNLAAPGIKNTRATRYYLSCLTFNPQGATINLQ